VTYREKLTKAWETLRPAQRKKAIFVVIAVGIILLSLAFYKATRTDHTENKPALKKRELSLKRVPSRNPFTTNRPDRWAPCKKRSKRSRGSSRAFLTVKRWTLTGRNDLISRRSLHVCRSSSKE